MPDLNSANLAATRNRLTYGIEIELSVGSFDRATEVIAAAIPGARAGYHEVVMTDGRKWKLVYDGSVSGPEIVSPVLTGGSDGAEGSDMATVQNVVRALRRAGMRTDPDRCGIHVHVGDPSGYNAKTIGIAAAITASHDWLIRESCTSNARNTHGPYGQGWAAPLDLDKAKRLRKCRSLAAVKREWYDGDEYRIARAQTNHYDRSRYCGINLHSLFFCNRGTLEFRYFDGTLHAGKVCAFVALALGIVAYAKLAKSAGVRRKNLDLGDKRWTMYRFLYHKLCLTGDANKAVRDNLCAAFPMLRPMRGGREATL